jgi:hypothetical protein
MAHKYQIVELVQEGWTYLEVKDYTWQIEALVYETFNLLAQKTTKMHELIILCLMTLSMANGSVLCHLPKLR